VNTVGVTRVSESAWRATAFVDAAGTGTYRRRVRGTAPLAAALGNSGYLAMTRRRASKAGSETAPVAARPEHGHGQAKAARGKALPGNGALRERLAAVERECDALRAELERFKAHQRQLEEAQDKVRDRLTWALDSLHSLLDSKT
jgi:hypothetical protein